MTMFFSAEPVTDFTSAMKADTTRYAEHYCNLLGQGIYLAPSQFEVAFISAAHTANDLEKLQKMTEWSFKKMADR
jgi:glutamate-1-semialdehyde 2,1-aminomutase